MHALARGQRSIGKLFARARSRSNLRRR